MSESAVCATCGIKVRATWRRCPGCREVLADGPMGPSESRRSRAQSGPSPARPRAVAMGLGAALVVTLAGSYWAARSSSPVVAAATSARPITAPVTDRPRPSARDLNGDAVAQQAAAAGRAGSAAYAQGDLVSALAEYEKAVAQEPGDAVARGNLAQVLVRLGRVDEALPHLDLVVQAQPEAWAPHFNRGRAHSLLKRWPAAIADYTTAARLFPDDYVTHYNLGLAHARTNDHGAAAAAFERAVALAPGEPSFLVALGTEYLALNRLTDSRRIFEQYVRDQPDGAEAANVRTLLQTLPSP